MSNLAPVVSSSTPALGEAYGIGNSILVSITFEDEDPLETLSLEWGDSAAESESAPETPDSNGEASFYLLGLEKGEHVVSVSVTDAFGALSSASVLFEVTELDLDGDGRSSDDGDCDDAEASIHPDAE